MAVILSVLPSTHPTALWLRPWKSADLPALLAAHRDPLLRRWLATSLTTDAQARHWLDTQSAGWHSATRFSFAVVADPDGHPPLAHVVIKVATAGQAEVGYWTAAHARGHGIAARAVQTVSHWALTGQAPIPLTRLNLLHATDNHASCRVALKCGYPLHDLLPAAPPTFPTTAHRHVRTTIAGDVH